MARFERLDVGSVVVVVVIVTAPASMVPTASPFKRRQQRGRASARRRSARRARRPSRPPGRPPAWRSCRRWPCPPSPSRAPPPRPRSGTVAPDASSTPAVAPATTSRRAFNRAARLPASVSAFTLKSPPPLAALTLATTGTKPPAVSRSSSDGRPAGFGTPTRPRLTFRPSAAVKSGACRTGATRGVGAGEPDRLHAGGVQRRHQPRVQASRPAPRRPRRAWPRR